MYSNANNSSTTTTTSSSSNRKASRETCASSPSPASSPATPSADLNPSEPLFTEYSSQSAMLDSIGAWSSVQPIPTSHAPLADMHELRGKYGAMALDHKPQQHAMGPYPGTDTMGSVNGNGDSSSRGSNTITNNNGFSVDNMHATSAAAAAAAAASAASSGYRIPADVDYSELDEAILRGRSTTLPNIFAVPNPAYRFSTVAGIDTSGSPAPISPVSSSTLGMLSRHGSISISNSNRTVSPLSVTINSNQIHRTASLDNNNPHHISGSVSSTSTLAGIGSTSAMPLRMLSEYPVETSQQHPALGLASYTMAPVAAAPGGNNPGSGDASVNGSGGMSHGSVGRATLAPPSTPGITGNASSSPSSSQSAAAHAASSASPSAANGQVSNEQQQQPGDANAYPPGMHARYAQLGHHLPTMREEDPSATLEPAATTLGDSALLRNMSMPSFGNSSMAAPLPHQLISSSSGLFALNRVSTASPTGANRRTSVEPVATSFAASDSASDNDLHSASMYSPQRVRSLKDMRRPSLDVRSDNVAGDTMLDGSAAANALFERSSGIRQSMAMNYLSGMTNLHRRHSLAGANPLMNPSAATGAAFGPATTRDFSANPAHLTEGALCNGEYVMYPPPTMQQNVYQQGSMYPTSYGAFAALPDQIRRQQNISSQPSMQNQQTQQQQQIYAYQQFPPATAGNASMCSSSGGAPLMPPLPGMVPHAGFYAGSFVGSQPIPPVPPLPPHQQQQHSATKPLQPMNIQPNQPPLIQPVPVPPTMQQQVQLQSTPQQRPLHSQSQHQHQRQQSQQQSKQPQHHHMRRASHSAIVSMGHANSPVPLYPPMPMMNGGGSGGGSHTLLPNPATTITPNMPFADMGKGLPFQSLPKEARIFVVQFKGERCDLFFSPTKDMDVMVIPTLAVSAVPVPAPDAAAPDQPSESQYSPGTHVLVEADRGVDLGVIREELLTDEAVRSFSAALSDSATGSGGAFGDFAHSDGRSSVAPADGSASVASTSSHGSKPSSNGAGHHSVSRKASIGDSLSLALAGPLAAGSPKDVLIKRIFRVADQREVADLTNNKLLDEQNALTMCQSKVQQRKLSMCVFDAEFQFDRRKLTFYYKADRRVDFRELVRELFKHFKTRLWMCQQTR